MCVNRRPISIFYGFWAFHNKHVNALHCGYHSTFCSSGCLQQHFLQQMTSLDNLKTHERLGKTIISAKLCLSNVFVDFLVTMKPSIDVGKGHPLHSYPKARSRALDTATTCLQHDRQRPAPTEKVLKSAQIVSCLRRRT